MFKHAHSLLLLLTKSTGNFPGLNESLMHSAHCAPFFFAATMPKHGGLCCGESGPGSRGADLVNSTRVSNAFPKEARCAIEFC